MCRAICNDVQIVENWGMNKNLQDLIDSAYDVAEETAAFDRFLIEAKSYLFGGSGAAKVQDHVGQSVHDDPELDRHTDRVQRLIQRSLIANSGNQNRFHAVLEMSASTELVQGNEAAERLMGKVFPIHLDDLPVDREAAVFIRKFRSTSAKNLSGDQVFLATVETPQARSCMALIQRPEDVAGNIRLSISYIDWSTRLVNRIGEAFGLSEREASVLSGYLHRHSQNEIATIQGRGLETIKSQSKSILRKTGCGRMSDVVQMAASIAYLLRDIPDNLESQSQLAWHTPDEDMHTLQLVNQRSLAWYRIGGGTRPILFIHGLVQGPFFTKEFISELTKHDAYLVCPSRPGFGHTSPSLSRENYNATTVSDACDLLRYLKIEKCPLIVHQGGSSHGFRIANELGLACAGVLVVDGGVPRLGLASYKLRGVEVFLRELYSASQTDIAALETNEIQSIAARGIFHVTEQSSEIWVRDGNAAMEDWEKDLHLYKGKQTWILGDDARVLSTDWIIQNLKALEIAEIIVLENAGNTLLHTHSEKVLEALVRILDVPPEA